MSLVFKALEYLGLMTADLALVLFWMFFWLEWAPVIARDARRVVRGARTLFLAIGWAGAILRLFLA